MNTSPCPHCKNRNDIVCTDTHCDIAGPGKPHEPNECRVCWLRLGGDPRVRAQEPFGPGTELKKLLLSLGLRSNAGCDCNVKAAQMDRWGAAGCRERRDEITQWLRDNAKERGWVEKAKAAVLAAAQGIAFELNPSDLYGSLVDLAIQKAESVPAR